MTLSFLVFKMKRIVKEILSYVLIIVLVLLVKKYIFSPIKVNGDSMYPTLHNKDIMILNEIGYYLNGLERFDIVVVDTGKDKLIKRVIGLPGESVRYFENELYINEELVEEDFNHAITHNFEMREINESVIPKGFYFVVGDNRGDSLDSRTIGLVSKKQIMGKTNFVVFPFKRFGSVK